MKKLWTDLLALALALTLTAPAAASAEVLRINGQNLWTESKARLIDNTTYVSLRTVAGALAPDAQVSWRGGAAWVEGDGLTLRARPGDTYLTVNDRALYIPGGVLIENGTVLVPIRVLTEALGGQVSWSFHQGVTVAVGSGRPAAAPYTADDLYWMSRIISSESRGEPLLGKIAVGTVVLNRVANKEFPNTIYDVIFDRKWGVQFQPTANGTIYHEPTAESVLAAKLVLEGARAADDSLYFLAPNLTQNHWIMNNRDYVTTIGCHWFYR